MLDQDPNTYTYKAYTLMQELANSQDRQGFRNFAEWLLGKESDAFKQCSNDHSVLYESCFELFKSITRGHYPNEDHDEIFQIYNTLDQYINYNQPIPR